MCTSLFAATYLPVRMLGPFSSEKFTLVLDRIVVAILEKCSFLLFLLLSIRLPKHLFSHKKLLNYAFHFVGNNFSVRPLVQKIQKVEVEAGHIHIFSSERLQSAVIGRLEEEK